MGLFLHFSLIPALFIVVVLCFLQRRVNKMEIDEKIAFLKGRFGIIVPLDFIGSLSNRWSYGFAFGAVASNVLILFSEKYVPFNVPSWAKAIVSLVGALEVGIAYYPIFICLSTDFKAVGGVCGILYTLMLICVLLWNIIKCPSSSVIGYHQEMAVNWPSLICLLFLLAKFIHKLVKAIRVNLRFDMEEEQEHILQTHQARHVQSLLRRRKLEKNWFQRKIYDWDPNFKFPNRMIGTSIISLICLYIFTLAEYSVSAIAFKELDLFKEALKVVGESSNETDNILTKSIPQIEEFNKVAKGTWFVTTFLACATSVTYIFHILACYRKHLMRLWAGQKGFLPQKFHNPSPAASVAAIARYSGWQIAYTLWGYLILHFGMFIFGLGIAYGCILPIQKGHGLQLLKVFGISFLTFALIIGLVIIQIVIAQIFFLQDKISPEDKGKPLALNNKKAFQNFSYFLLFYNAIMGLGNCIFRLICSFVVGTWLISRIDRTIMQRGYERADPGYGTWISMIFFDHYHNNPVILCFCHLLLAEKTIMQRKNLSLYCQFSNTSEPAVNSKARSRWLLLYTLFNNPCLILLRKRKTASNSPSCRRSLDRMTLTYGLASRYRGMVKKPAESSPVNGSVCVFLPQGLCESKAVPTRRGSL
ncbi:STRA6-like isoform X2 [Polyodon spathula]|nr:STRA6-like isoform X2 [Polyodon spathula]